MIREKTPRERFELPIPKGVLFESTALPDFTPCRLLNKALCDLGIIMLIVKYPTIKRISIQIK